MSLIINVCYGVIVRHVCWRSINLKENRLLILGPLQSVSGIKLPAEDAAAQTSLASPRSGTESAASMARWQSWRYIPHWIQSAALSPRSDAGSGWRWSRRTGLERWESGIWTGRSVQPSWWGCPACCLRWCRTEFWSQSVAVKQRENKSYFMVQDTRWFLIKHNWETTPT